MKISEIITDKYKLRLSPTVYYDLLADVREVEEEQEPFKPMVEIDLDYVIKQKYIEREVLDKIRTEIKALSNANPSYWHSGDMVEREEVFDVIDKYKAETEAEDGNEH